MSDATVIAEECTHIWPDRHCSECQAYGRISPLAAKPLLHELEAAERRLEALKSDYLKRWGWVQTSHTPGSYWLWRRDFSDYDRKFDPWHAANPDRQRTTYGVFTAETDLAVSMTRAVLDEQLELGGDDE